MVSQSNRLAMPPCRPSPKSGSWHTWQVPPFKCDTAIALKNNLCINFIKNIIVRGWPQWLEFILTGIKSPVYSVSVVPKAKVLVSKLKKAIRCTPKNICGKFHDIPSNNCQNISLWITSENLMIVLKKKWEDHQSEDLEICQTGVKRLTNARKYPLHHTYKGNFSIF